MGRAAIEENSRMSIRIRPADKAKIMRASALSGSDMTDFVVRTAVEAAENVIDRAERIILSERDSLRVLELLENPPAPNDKLIAAAKGLPRFR